MEDIKPQRNKFYVGVLPDSPEIKAKQYKDEEISTASSKPLDWSEDRVIKNYPTRNQNGSGSCLAQSIAKALTILFGDSRSALPIYKKRRNYPQTGMFANDAADIARKIGTALESVIPSQNMSDTDMDAVVYENNKVKPEIDGVIWVNDFSIDNLARVVEEQKHLVICFNSSYEEYDYFKSPYIGYRADIPTKWSHAVCLVDRKGSLGYKWMAAENSWGDIGLTEDTQFLSEEFCKNRIHTAFYLLPKKEVPLPAYSFTRNLVKGSSGKDVAVLQNFLKHAGYMPSGIPSTGFYGDITVSAVKKLQAVYGIQQTGNFGPITRAKVNELILKPGLLDSILIKLKLK